MSETLHAPIRMCMGCGKRSAQKSLLRIKVSAQGHLHVAAGRVHVGRSGYLHQERQCWSQFAARKGAVRSLARSFAKEERAAFVNLLHETLAPKSEVSGHVA